MIELFTVEVSLKISMCINIECLIERVINFPQKSGKDIT